MVTTLSGSVLVTGATGFIGSALARRLVARGASVGGLVRAASRNRLPDGVEPVVADLAQPDTLAGATAGFDHVIHVAALLGEPANRDGADAERHRRVNVDAALRLARESLETGVRRFVQVSTIGVYGDAERLDITDSTPPRPDCAYHRTKYAADRGLLDLHASRGLPVVIVRPPITVGPGNLRTHLLPMARLAAYGAFPTFGADLSQRLPLIEVDDLCDALERSATAGSPGDTYLVSSGEQYAFGDILGAMARFSGRRSATIYCPALVGEIAARVFEMLAHLTGMSPPLTRRSLVAFRQDRTVDIAKARRVLGFTPRYTRIDDLLRRALEDYRERGLLPRRGASRRR